MPIPAEIDPSAAAGGSADREQAVVVRDGALATPTVTSPPFSISRMPAPPAPTAKVLEVPSALATSSSPPSSVTEPWLPAWAADRRREGRHLAGDAVGHAVDQQRAAAGVADGELARRRPIAAIDRRGALAAGRLADIGAAVRNARGDAQQVERASARSSDDHRASGRDRLEVQDRAVAAGRLANDEGVRRRRAGKRQRAAHQGEKALPRAAHGRLRLSGQQGAAGERERAATVNDDRDAAESLGRDLPGQRGRSIGHDLADGAVAGHRVGARTERGDVGAARRRRADIPVGGIEEVVVAAGRRLPLEGARDGRLVDRDRGLPGPRGEVGDGDLDLVVNAGAAAGLIGQALQAPLDLGQRAGNTDLGAAADIDGGDAVDPEHAAAHGCVRGDRHRIRHLVERDRAGGKWRLQDDVRHEDAGPDGAAQRVRREDAWRYVRRTGATKLMAVVEPTTLATSGRGPPGRPTA